MRLIAAVKKLSPPLAVLAVLIGGWYALAYTLDNNFASGDGSALIIPPPHRLFEGLNNIYFSKHRFRRFDFGPDYRTVARHPHEYVAGA